MVSKMRLFPLIFLIEISLSFLTFGESNSDNCFFKLPENSLFVCQDISDSLYFLNENIRSEVGAQSLKWDYNLAVKAQKWADYLAENGFLKHETDEIYGENIYACKGFKPRLIDAIRNWYTEKEKFRYGNNLWCKKGSLCGHYTQLIWKTTKKIGCGIAKYPKEYRQLDFVIVCKFYPAGNIVQKDPF